MQEALLLEGADDQDLFDFERNLNDVSDLPEELLNAVAELTGEDTDTLRWEPPSTPPSPLRLSQFLLLHVLACKTARVCMFSREHGCQCKAFEAGGPYATPAA